MINKFLWSLLAVAFLSSGCAATRRAEVYPMSYDQTYQTALEALDHVGRWKLLETDQLNGLIVLEKGGYFMPRRTAKVVVRRLEPYKTKIELFENRSPKSHEKFFDAMDERVRSRALTYPT